MILEVLTPAFSKALLNSLAVSLTAGALSLAIALPLGVFAGLYDFTGKKFFLLSLVLPLLLPSFLLSIGLSNAEINFGLSGLPDFSNVVLIHSAFILPLVFFGSLLSVQKLSEGQLNSARVFGGEWLALVQSMRFTFPTALGIAAFGGLLSLSDPGPGQIFGISVVASEYLQSFSAFYDFSLAFKQIAVVAILVAVLSAPLVWWLSPRLSNLIFSKQHAIRTLPKHSPILPFAFSLVLLVLIIFPFVGLVTPLLDGFPLARAWPEIERTFLNTILFSGAAAIISTSFAFFLAYLVRSQGRTRQFALWLSFFLLSLPPVLSALGFLFFSSQISESYDFLLRSRFTVILSLAFRFLPVSFLFLLRSVNTVSPTWYDSAQVHGVPKLTFFYRVFWPWVRPAVLVTLIATAILATAEVTPALLLRPPGQDSLPVAIFTVMANAPESLVAALCLIYFLGAAGALFLSGSFIRKQTV